MRMYAACLASYNNGTLHGAWFDLEDYSDTESLLEDIAGEVLRTSPYPNVTVTCPECEGHCGGEWSDCEVCGNTGEVPSAEEWAAHDWDGEGLSGFGEYPDLDKVLEHVRLVGEHGEAWIAFKDAFGDSVTEENFTKAYRGEYQSEEDFAEEYTCEVQGWNGDEFFYSWIDWKAAWNCSLRFDFTFSDGYVFYSNW